MNEVEYYQALAAELQQGFANSLAQQAANYEGQLAMLRVQSRAEIESLKAKVAEYEGTEDVPEAVAEPVEKPAKKPR